MLLAKCRLITIILFAYALLFSGVNQILGEQSPIPASVLQFLDPVLGYCLILIPELIFFENFRPFDKVAIIREATENALNMVLPFVVMAVVLVFASSFNMVAFARLEETGFVTSVLLQILLLYLGIEIVSTVTSVVGSVVWWIFYR